MVGTSLQITVELGPAARAPSRPNTTDTQTDLRKRRCPRAVPARPLHGRSRSTSQLLEQTWTPTPNRAGPGPSPTNPLSPEQEHALQRSLASSGYHSVSDLLRVYVDDTQSTAGKGGVAVLTTVPSRATRSVGTPESATAVPTSASWGTLPPDALSLPIPPAPVLAIAPVAGSSDTATTVFSSAGHLSGGAPELGTTGPELAVLLSGTKALRHLRRLVTSARLPVWATRDWFQHGEREQPRQNGCLGTGTSTRAETAAEDTSHAPPEHPQPSPVLPQSGATAPATPPGSVPGRPAVLLLSPPSSAHSTPSTPAAVPTAAPDDTPATLPGRPATAEDLDRLVLAVLEESLASATTPVRSPGAAWLDPLVLVSRSVQRLLLAPHSDALAYLAFQFGPGLLPVARRIPVRFDTPAEAAAAVGEAVGELERPDTSDTWTQKYHTMHDVQNALLDPTVSPDVAAAAMETIAAPAMLARLMASGDSSRLLVLERYVALLAAVACLAPRLLQAAQAQEVYTRVACRYLALLCGAPRYFLRRTVNHAWCRAMAAVPLEAVVGSLETVVGPVLDAAVLPRLLHPARLQAVCHGLKFLVAARAREFQPAQVELLARVLARPVVLQLAHCSQAAVRSEAADLCLVVHAVLPHSAAAAAVCLLPA